jgi:hypothetical protein
LREEKIPDVSSREKKNTEGAQAAMKSRMEKRA